MPDRAAIRNVPPGAVGFPVGWREWRLWSVASATASHTEGVIRLVATDLDGTLWGPDMVVPERHSQAIGELARRGVTVLAATSRRPRAVRPCFERVGLALPAVLVDGAIGVDFRTGDRFHQVVFDPAGALAVLATFRGAGLEPCVYVEDPDVDVLVSQTPSTCGAHLHYLGGFARAEDLDAALAALPVYAFSVLGVARERLGRLRLRGRSGSGPAFGQPDLWEIFPGAL